MTSKPEIQLPEGEVHIWLEPLSLTPDALTQAKRLLSQEEVTRADRFHHHRDHDRYVAAHARLRRILSKYTRTEPSDLVFEHRESGKPFLKAAKIEHLVNFNLSHSGDWFLLGVVRNARIGVDIEEIKSESATLEVAERFFTKRENTELQSLPPDQRTIAFFRCWTRKEAYLKALGCGLSVSPADCEVSLFSEALPEIRNRIAGDASEWSLFHLESPGCVAAASIDEKGVTVKKKSG